MSLNDTLDRLAKEREEKEQGVQTAKAACHPIISGFAERIFFERMLKEINPGMSEQKIDALIDRSVMIATKLFNKLTVRYEKDNVQ